MPAPSLLVVVRHAESERNRIKGGRVFFDDDQAAEAIRGVPDPLVPISEQGWRDARALGRSLASDFGDFDAIVHSGYLRTIQTAEAIAESWSPNRRAAVAVGEDVLVRERDAGYAFSMTTSEADAAFPWLQAHWRGTGPLLARPPGGESLADVVVRVGLFLERLARSHAGRRVLVVTHGGTCRAFRFLLDRQTRSEFERDFDATPVLNCAVMAFRATGETTLERRSGPASAAAPARTPCRS